VTSCANVFIMNNLFNWKEILYSTTCCGIFRKFSNLSRILFNSYFVCLEFLNQLIWFCWKFEMLNKFSHIPCVENFDFMYLMAYWWGLSKLAHNFVKPNITLKNKVISIQICILEQCQWLLCHLACMVIQILFHSHWKHLMVINVSYVTSILMLM
jgi:hypothetical protein